jgi:hypothetical protein
MRKASSHRLAFKNEVDLDDELDRSPIADSYRDFMWGAYSMVSPRRYRTIGAPPEERADGTHTRVNETIDASVFESWRTRKAYRPPSLVNWAAAKKIDPATIVNSVRADNPSVVVPD